MLEELARIVVQIAIRAILKKLWALILPHISGAYENVLIAICRRYRVPEPPFIVRLSARLLAKRGIAVPGPIFLTLGGSINGRLTLEPRVVRGRLGEIITT